LRGDSVTVEILEVVDGESLWTMMACGSCCMVAATATSGSPFEFHSRIWSLEPGEVAFPVETNWATLPYWAAAGWLRRDPRPCSSREAARQKIRHALAGIPIELQANGREAIDEAVC